MSLISILILICIVISTIVKGCKEIISAKKIKDPEIRSQNLFSGYGLLICGIISLGLLIYAFFFI